MTSLYTATGISPGSYIVDITQKKDARRLNLRKIRDTEKYKKYRKLLKSAQLKEEEQKKGKRAFHTVLESSDVKPLF
jgi:hypothetical protein